MPASGHPITRFTPHLPFALLAVLLGFLWLAGGASRADVMGQVVVRSVAWAVLIAFVILGPRPRLREVKGPAFFVFAATALAAIQLVPLPPALWTELPGRDLLTRAATVLGEEQPWRPISISPGATLNALSSLIVAIVTLLLSAALTRAAHWRTASILLALVVAASLLGLVQFSGARFDHPLINDVARSVSGSFANRNHFALFAAIGCILAPAWAFPEEGRAKWKPLSALGLLVLFALIILATGSRSGMVVGIVGIGLGLMNVRSQLQSKLRRLPRGWALALIVSAAGALIVAVILSVTLDRAVSVERASVLEAGEDLRVRALPVIIEMTKLYFPVGSGLGAFDPVYRIHEPSALLGTAYLNHAHNDWLEVVLDAGLLGLLLLIAVVVWWLRRSARVWTIRNTRDGMLPRTGSGILLLVMLASVTDYPVRTPMIMAVVVLAAVWLSTGVRPQPSTEAAATGAH